jgi:hypothetical protein
MHYEKEKKAAAAFWKSYFSKLSPQAKVAQALKQDQGQPIPPTQAAPMPPTQTDKNPKPSE